MPLSLIAAGALLTTPPAKPSTSLVGFRATRMSRRPFSLGTGPALAQVSGLGPSAAAPRPGEVA